MTEREDVQMAAPRLAIKVAELMKLAVSQSSKSQREIAELMDISESRLSQIVNGDGNVHTATIARVFSAAGCSLDLRVFDADGHEVEIPRRGRRSRTQVPAIFVHPVQGESGQVHNVISYSHFPVVGAPVDYPLQVESAAEAKQLCAANAFEYEFGGDLVR